MESERWSREEIRAYQEEQLRGLVEHAYQSVPYYRDRMRELNLRPGDIRKLEDLHKLPILTKEDVRRHGPRLRAVNTNSKDLLRSCTSGTTGKSLHFDVTRSAIAFRWAVWWRHRMRFGVDVGDWHANFTGKLVVPPDQADPPFWRWNFPMHQIVLNMHHLVPEKVEVIAEFLGKRGPLFYSGYPSVIHAFALALLERGVELPARPRFVFTAAENMLEYQRRDIAWLTGAVLSDHYGFAEGCGNASRCPNLVYHEDFEFGILECVDPEPVPEGIRGRIVATGFASRAFPFIRYEVGDVGIWAPESEGCVCGRESRVLNSIVGRVDDYVVTPEGRRIMRLDYIFKDALAVKESQIVQRRPGAIEVRVVRRPGYANHDEDMIRREVARWISPRIEVNFSYLDEIPREPNGKFKAVKSFLRRTASDGSGVGSAAKPFSTTEEGFGV